MSTYVLSRIAFPFGSTEYRFRQIPRIGRLCEKCCATCASLVGVLCVYHAAIRQRIQDAAKNLDLRIKLKNCHAGIMTSLR